MTVQPLGDRVQIPADVAATLRPGHVMWFDTQAVGAPVERRFLCVTQSDIDRGWVHAERLRRLRPGDVGMTTDADDVRSLTGSMEPAPVNDAVAFPPLHVGYVGRYWRCNLTEIRKQLLLPVTEDATVGVWIVEAPWAHPIWHSYAAVLVHLRPLSDKRPTVFYLEGASHEFWLFALSPEVRREPAIRGRENPVARTLSPKQFAAQFIEPSDEAATARVEAALKEVCSGHLSPDSGHHHQLEWAVRFGANMMKGQT